jgi:hypothetical protein
MQYSHIASDTSQGAWGEPGVEPWLVVRWGILHSASLSNSIVNATRAWDSSAVNGKPRFIAASINLVPDYSHTKVDAAIIGPILKSNFFTVATCVTMGPRFKGLPLDMQH